MISVNADFLLQSFVIPIFLILPEFILSSFLTQSLLLEFSSCLSSDFLKRRSFSFNMPWRYQISITKCLYSSREDLPKKLFKITVQEGKKPLSVDSCSSKTSLLKIPRQCLTNTDWEHCFQTSLVYSRNRRASSSSHESDKFYLHSYNLLVLLSLRKTRDFLSLDLAQLQLKMVLLARNQFNNNSCRYLILFVLHWQMTTTLFSPATGKFKISYVKDINIVLTNVEQGSFKLTSLLAVAGRDRSTWLNWIQMPSFLISLQRKRHRRLFII